MYDHANFYQIWRSFISTRFILSSTQTSEIATQLEFPAVTICNQGKFKRSAVLGENALNLSSSSSSVTKAFIIEVGITEQYFTFVANIFIFWVCILSKNVSRKRDAIKLYTAFWLPLTLTVKGVWTFRDFVFQIQKVCELKVKFKTAISIIVTIYLLKI